MIREKKGSRWNAGMTFVFALIFILSSCAAAEENGSQGEPAGISDDSEDGHSNHDVDSFMHIHGLAYDPSQTESLYLATHHGLIHIDADGNWQWTAEDVHRHDLMGFTITSEGHFISSGHPAERSDLEDPLGVIVSNDHGQTWEPIALHGVVDFHVMEVNAGNANVIYGLNTYGAEQGLYRSEDGGQNWEAVQGDGLPDNLHEVYTIISHPENAEWVLAGTATGLLSSTDGGQSWHVYRAEYSMTAASVVGDSNVVVAYLVGEPEGLYRSADFGETWDSLDFMVEDDAGFYIAVEPHRTNIMTIGTYQEHLYRTMDGGHTWEQLADGGNPLHDDKK